MTIDKEKLISLLEERTELERDDVESQLSELINRIQQAADEGKTFEVEGFGTFSMQEDTLHFEPNDRLETEINNKYAGMKPIELIGAFKEPEANDEVPEMADPDDLQSDEKWEFDSEGDQSEEETEKVEELEETIPEPRQEVSAPTVDVGEESADDVFDSVFGSTADTSDEEIEFEEDDETGTSSEKELQEEKSKDTIGTILVALVVIISLGISGYVIYDLSNSDSSSPQELASTSQQTESTPQSTEDEADPIEEEGEEDSSEPEEDTEVPTGEESETQLNDGEERYGLHGTPNESISSGYTIVVHSLNDVNKAEENKQRLQEAGFRALISQAQVQGTTYYRVGLGQFETVSDAQEAIQEIPREYRESNFIKRIQ